jgi:hypothetical protein
MGGWDGRNADTEEKEGIELQRERHGKERNDATDGSTVRDTFYGIRT